ncbi:HNH endonuclease [Atlantibacter hermannii]|uniref:HNH endonuclease n=1 Tax=Atlantibacter hermannii TaxID=565 RepID=UPI0028AC0AFE|nr:HNH endonuclease [Atlantibacter hermannii]
MKKILTQALLKSLVSYNPENGEFRWLISRGGSAKAGCIAGTVDKITGYKHISVCQKRYKAHRLAFLWMNGFLPPDDMDVDHVNHIKSDNSFNNLRIVTTSVNSQNRISAREDSATGIIGVGIDRRTGKWRARIQVGDKRIYLGSYDEESLASSAYLAAKRQFHEGNTL